MGHHKHALNNRPHNWLQTAFPWLSLLLCTSFVFYKYVLQVSPAVMAPELMSTFHLTGASLGALAGCFLYASFAMQLPAGLLLDRYNPYYVIALGIVACASGAFIFAF